LRGDDPDFKATSKAMFARAPYEVDAGHSLPQAMLRAAGTASTPIGMSFWTDAAILGDAGIPSILYGPMGAGLHSIEEWVNVQSVMKCRDALVALARDWCR
jgi:acetylornithine deacetylase